MIVRKGVAPIFGEHGTARQARALIQVREGAWVIQCPFCPGPEANGRAAPAFDGSGNPIPLHVCPLCRNSAAGKRAVETIWPEPRYAHAIHDALIVRPRAHRWWIPGPPLYETHETLVAENLSHKLPPGKRLSLVD
ncbi:MAG: hypothetical protein IT175_06185 [Acidobacteria bacterium]|nr:hypothetical protein [Acidobacteriota bacterium]